MATDPFSLADHHHLGFYGKGQSSPSATLEGCDGFDPQKRTILVLPGTRVNHELPALALSPFIRGMIGQVQRSLDRTGVDANVICAVYGHNDEQSVSNHIAGSLSHERPARDGSAVPSGIDLHDLVDHVLLPQMGIRDGQHPSADEACAAMSRVTLVGNSYGSAFMQQAGKLLHNELVRKHGYSDADATRIVGELAGISTGVMANLSDDSPGIRTISYAAHKDETTWKTMHRISCEHIIDGVVSPETDAEKLHHHYYERCGFDPALQTGEAIHMPAHETVLDKPVAVQGGRGRLVRFTAPQELNLVLRGKSRLFVNREILDAECDQLNNGLAGFGLNLNGVNGEPLASKNLPPEHDIRMFFAPCEENKALSQSIDDMLATLVQRPVRNPQQSLSDSLDTLVQSAQLRSASLQAVPAPHVIAATHEDTLKQGPAASPPLN